MSRRGELANPLTLAVLATLTTGPLHPYEIARLLKHRGKDQSIKIRYGSLYTVVRNLERDGLVAAEGTARAGRRPERTVYRLTDAGRSALEERLRELVRSPAKEYPLFEAALSLVLVLHPDEVAALLAERLARLDEELAGARAQLRGLTADLRLPRLFLLEGEYALAVKQAEAEWVRAVLGEFADGSLDGLAEWRTWHETGQFPADYADLEWAQADLALRSGNHDEPAGGEAAPPA